MTGSRPRLNRVPRESVLLLVSVPGLPSRLGEPGPTTWMPDGEQLALITPLGAEEALRYGLSAETERLRVQMPVVTVKLPARLLLRERDWQVIRTEHWPSSTLLIVERVKGGPP